MRYKLSLTAICCLLVIPSLQLKAQTICDGGRYLQEIFAEVSVSSDIPYGSATTITGIDQTLLLDVYEPESDTVSRRPLIIFAHGGSFLFGNKESEDIVTLCDKYARHGYVTASINYRLGFEGFIPNDQTATETVYRATSDMRAAVRHFYKDVATDNNYRIDTNSIFVAGVSAGAFIALHLAYLDEESEIPEAINPAEFGGIEGNSGNPGYSSNIKAIVNLCGAIGDTAWISENDTPCLSMHGTNDDVVPYGSAQINVLTIPLFEVDGSASIAARQANQNVDHQFITWEGAGHTPFINDPAFMTSVFDNMTPFLADQLNCDTPLSADNITKSDDTSFRVYPNPSEGIINVMTDEVPEALELYSSTGKLVLSSKETKSINATDLNAGVYYLRVYNSEKVSFSKVILY